MEKCSVQIQFLLGPAGSGKTHRCLAEIRAELARSPEGAPLILLAPKQATFQLERQLLDSPLAGESQRASQLHGYTRLHILSFERLARFVFKQLGQPLPRLLDEEGRLMVLRALLARRRNDLKLFRASAKLTGFAQQLSLALRELQRNLLTPETLLSLADETGNASGLAPKLHDLALLLRDYLDWLKAHDLQDADCMLSAATEALLGGQRSEVGGQRSEARDQTSDLRPPTSDLRFWLDGFAEFSPQELDLLAAVVAQSERATIAFCLDHGQSENASWLSTWSLVRKTFEETRNRLAKIPGAEISAVELARNPAQNRFAGKPVLAHLEKFWPEPRPLAIYDLRFTNASLDGAITEDGTRNTEPAANSQLSTLNSQLRAATCANPEAEATLAAREILRFVRGGGRFREASVIVRRLEGYHQIVQRVFSRYDIPFFLDRRESVSHHPLAELTRSALRIAAFNWTHDDVFAALKTGLVAVDEAGLDRLENEALARGWKGATWSKPVEIPNENELALRLEMLRRQIIPPFQEFAATLAKTQNQPTGEQLSAAIRGLWRALDAEETLSEWASAPYHASRITHHAIHSTVWEQMNSWADNLARAFPSDQLPLREWLPILEAGLSSLAVGVIPPALDQVLIGAIDRSRNPDIKLALVLGLNEGVFPAPPPRAALLTDSDRETLERRGIALGTTTRLHIGRERYFGYIACTRARQRLVLTCAALDVNDAPLNPSPFFSRIKQLFPQLEIETVPRAADWRDSEHANELIAPLLKSQISNLKSQIPQKLAEIPPLQSALDRLRHFQVQSSAESLSPALAGKLFGATLRTSVSRLEQFAACPFRFFIHSGLRAEERKLFELDAREQGSFQHDVLAQFHQQLRDEGRRWRDITPGEARDRVGKIAQSVVANYRDGLLDSSAETKFTARVMIESLQDFVETLVEWMAGQYAFDPVAVELPFGESDTHPAWELDLGEGHRLALRGRIDRVDVCRDASADEAMCVVLDYKSSAKKLDSLLVANGLQLQLLAYLNVLRRWPNPRELFGAARLNPAGVFYVNLRGKYERQSNRADALAKVADARKLAYQHAGRFDERALSRLDSRDDASKGDQFNYRKTNDGSLHKGSRDALAAGELEALLESVEANLVRMGREIFSGAIEVSPFRKGAMTACEQCDYQAICRIDPWTHVFRALKAPKKTGDLK